MILAWLALAVGLGSAPQSVFSQCELLIDGSTNAEGTELFAGNTHEVYIRVRSLCAAAETFNMSNGFLVYSPDGADWISTSGRALQSWTDLGWTYSFINHFHKSTGADKFEPVQPVSAPAPGSDSAVVLFVGISFITDGGLPGGFDSPAWSIEIQTRLADIGRQICIDTAFTPPGGTWNWASLVGPTTVTPAWGGPYCFTIVEGDRDGDGVGDVTDNCIDAPNPDQTDGDADGVGLACDCDDSDPNLSANSVWYADLDGDGYGDAQASQFDCERPVGYVSAAGDCDDNNANIYPGAPELCDGLVNDCNGSTLPPEEVDNESDGYVECSIDVGGWDGDLSVVGGDDNCPNDYNPGQEDSDGDNIGDVCDGCCVGRVGDANGLGGDEPTIGDVSVMIDALFISGDPQVIACLAEADINQSGGIEPEESGITIGDVSTLIDYLFITGPTLGLPECL